MERDKEGQRERHTERERDWERRRDGKRRRETERDGERTGGRSAIPSERNTKGGDKREENIMDREKHTLPPSLPPSLPLSLLLSLHPYLPHSLCEAVCICLSLSLSLSVSTPDAGDASLLAVLVAVEYPAVGYSSFLRAHREWVCVRVCVYVCPPDVVGRSNGLPQRISSESWRICD